MTLAIAEPRTTSRERPSSGWRAFWLKEDWWAVWLGLGIVVVAYALFAEGLSLKYVAVTPAKWSSVAQLGADLVGNTPRYLVQFCLWQVIFGLPLAALGFKLRHFVPAFTALYVLSIGAFVIGQWDQAVTYNLEPPLVALAVGLVASNTLRLPAWIDAGFRVEFYIKIGIILLGATVPLSLIVYAGPLAILQASIVSIATFLVIYFFGLRLGLDRRFAATLGAGGAVCGVSAAIAIAGAVGAKREHAAITITIVVLWAIVFVFALPICARLLHLPIGVGGAWIGTSEFADAAGFAAAQSYANLAGRVDGITGTSDQAILAYTLIKVVGRDVWIGIWAFVLALIATFKWDRQPGSSTKPDAAQIWLRFPKFVIGFLLASIFVTLVTRHLSLADYNKVAVPAFVGPVKDLRTWTFIFSFFSIGLMTRVRDLTSAGVRPVLAFSGGVVVNVILGLVLSALVFATHWESLGQ